MLPAQTVIVAALLGRAVGLRQWPDVHLDELDHQRWDQQGFMTNNILAFVNPCDQFAFGSGRHSGHRTNGADWLRTAYHDMANADVNSGVGGLDASIRLQEEQLRPENTGDGFNNTMFAVSQLTSRYFSIADGIALSAVMAVEQCGGPEIPFRGGRIDAKQAGPSGVPEPDQDLAMHTASFARQGFTAIEMIGLIACGHTIGGVQQQFFPQIVPQSQVDPDTNIPGNTHFDTTYAQFDNTIAKEYLAGTTQNPLVTGFNITTRSDLRIFSSDGNATMKSFADSNQHFLSTCGTLFERMINTVPAGVMLTDIVEPLPVKPHRLTLRRSIDGAFSLQGFFRFWNMLDSEQTHVNLTWGADNGKSCAGCTIPLTHDSTWVGTTMPRNETSLWFLLLDQVLPVESPESLSKFWFNVIEGGKPRTEDQDGHGFPLQTNVVVSSSTCILSIDPEDSSTTSLRVDIAVKKGLEVTTVWVEADDVEFSTDSSVVRNTGEPATFVARLNESSSAMDAAYDIYSVTIDRKAVVNLSSMNVAATIGGQTTADWTTFHAGDSWVQQC